MKKKILLSSMICLTALRTLAVEEAPFTFEASYTGDVVANTLGGIKKGTSYLGKGNIGILFETEKANFWKGGSFKIGIENTHGDSPSANLIGDYMVASNIEAGNHTYLSELWYTQKIEKITLQAGLMNLNATFAATDNASLLVNSAFGISPTISGNMHVPIFPMNGLGFVFSLDINDQLCLSAGVYDGQLTDWDKNPYNIRWHVDENEFLGILETHSSYKLFPRLSSDIKLGGYYRQNIATEMETFEKNYGIYLSYEQEILHTEKGPNLDLFTQLGIAPAYLNHNNIYLGFGCHTIRFWSTRPNDEASFGVAMAHFGNKQKTETNLEVTYRFQFLHNIYLQPDLQYIINPEGTEMKLENTLVAIVRFGLEF